MIDGKKEQQNVNRISNLSIIIILHIDYKKEI